MAPAGFPTPVDVVQAQVDAYNAHDLEALAAAYHSNAVVHNLAQGQTVTGLVAMRPLWQEWFATHPEHQAQIVTRLAVGEFVVDQEHITGFADGSTLEAVVLYRIQRGQIVECWMGY